MKHFLKDFILRAFIAAGGGPVVLAIIYGILDATGAVSVVSAREVCIGFLSVTFLAGFVGGMSVIYQQEQLPLPVAIAIHVATLYAAYLLFYWVTGWLNGSIGMFTVIFCLGYALIWLFIYIFTRKKADQINRKLHSKP